MWMTPATSHEMINCGRAETCTSVSLCVLSVMTRSANTGFQIWILRADATRICSLSSA